MKKKFAVWFLSLALLLPLLPTAQAAVTYNYAVQGGNLKFDPSTGTITDCDHSVTRADIPSAIQGVPVTEIKSNAFTQCRKLTAVTIPKTVTTIGEYAFGECTALPSIVIPDSVTTMGKRVFKGCTQLTDVALPGSISSVPTQTFSGCTSLKNVTLGEGITEVCNQSFYNCNSLKEIVLPDSIQTINYVTFGNCKELTKVTVGKNCSFISKAAFSSCPKMSSLYFSGNAPGTDGQIISSFADNFIVYYPVGATGWTTPTWNGYITRSYSPTPSQPTMVTAKPTASTVYVNGTVVAFDAYNINNNNYFKLRDLAFILSGSKAQFEVEWDSAANAIKLTSGRPYTPVGGEMVGKGAINKVGKLTKSAVYLDGKQVSFTAYNIDNNNYFKLRDIGQALDFSVEWNGVRQSIEIDTSLPYRPE